MIKGKKRPAEKETENKSEDVSKSKKPHIAAKTGGKTFTPKEKSNSAENTVMKFTPKEGSKKPEKNAEKSVKKFTPKDGSKKPEKNAEKSVKKFTPKDGSKKPGKTFTPKDGGPENKFKKPTLKPGQLFKKKKDGEEEPPEKTDWRKFKQDKKDLRLKRRQTKDKDSYDVSIEAKQIYEKLKCRKTTNKKELVENLYNITKGDVLKKLVMAHDTARIVQCMLKNATPAQRDSILEELLPIAVDMSISKYAHFCILHMIKFCSNASKQKLVDSYIGSIVKLASHNVSSKILDQVYLSVATETQKSFMRQEFYGDLYKKSKDNTVKTLADTYKDTTHMKTAILGSLKSNLEHVANKGLVDSSLVHAVLLEYLKECEEDKREEIVGLYSPLVPMILTTKEGTHAAILSFWHSSPKGRRAIVKVIKEHLVKICVHEQGHVFLLAVLNSMDDTKAIKKALFDPIFAEYQTIIADKWGRKVLEWFVAPADTDCYHPHMISFIEEGLKFGKKDKETRRKEIFEQIEEPVTEAICENANAFVTDGHIGLVTASILNKMSASFFEKASDAIAQIICKPDWTLELTIEPKKGQTEVTQTTVSGIEDAGMHIALKRILKQDIERTKNSEKSFGSFLVKNLTEKTVTAWTQTNRGCFVLVNIVQNNGEDTIELLKPLLKHHVTNLKKQNHVGAKLLLEKINL